MNGGRSRCLAAGGMLTGTVAGDGGRGRRLSLRRLHRGAAAQPTPASRRSNRAGFARPYRLTVLLGEERGLAELLRFINNLALNFLIAASLTRAQGGPVTQVVYAVGHNSPRDGRVGDPRERLNVPILQGEPGGEDGIGGVRGSALRLRAQGHLLRCCFGSWHPRRLRVSRRRGRAHCVPLLPLCPAGTGEDDASRGERAGLREHPPSRRRGRLLRPQPLCRAPALPSATAAAV